MSDKQRCQHCEDQGSLCAACERAAIASELAAPHCSGEWAPILAAAIVANCRRQIATLRMKMPINVALALGRADEELADCQAWMRADKENRQNIDS